MVWVALLIAVVAATVAFLLFWRFWFLRQPARDIPAEGIVSPASGRIVKIIRYGDGRPVGLPKGLLGTARAITEDVSSTGSIVVIMLSPLDVHYQRAPVAGTVTSVRYTPGRFRNAVLAARSLRAFENERNEILFQSPRATYKVVQVAGIAARRISCTVGSGQKVKKGSIIGLINFGSQVMLVLPETRVKVREGQRVTDGETVIA